ncbi:MAG: hypothetical protein MJ093_01550 [Saccharofermentans sp.]|nr:hypothetical protein [Saccharofermentans sp.]
MTNTIRKTLNLEMKDSYYNKADCIIEAQEIIDSEKITGMTVHQVAEEIYTHAFVFFNFHFLPKFIRETKLARRIFNSAANGVDLEDNGDTLKRRICYSLIWAFC